MQTLSNRMWSCFWSFIQKVNQRMHWIPFPVLFKSPNTLYNKMIHYRNHSAKSGFKKKFRMQFRIYHLIWEWIQDLCTKMGLVLRWDTDQSHWEHIWIHLILEQLQYVDCVRHNTASCKIDKYECMMTIALPWIQRNLWKFACFLAFKCLVYWDILST